MPERRMARCRYRSRDWCCHGRGHGRRGRLQGIEIGLDPKLRRLLEGKSSADQRRILPRFSDVELATRNMYDGKAPSKS